MSKNKTAPSQSTGILILGMHRSGTSALTRVINLLGAALGERLMPAGKGNASGHWESLAVYEAHEQLLTALGRRWDDFREMPADWIAHPQAALCAQAIRRFVADELASEPVWAVKEPRLCRLLPLWPQALSGLPVRLTAAIMVRNPLEVAASLARRDGMAYGHAYLLWTQHLLEAERATRGMPRLIVQYDELLADWRAVAEKLAEHLGCSWPRSIDAAASEIEAFLSPQLRHHDASQRQVDGDEVPPVLVQRLFDASRRAGADADGWRELAALAIEAERAASLYGPCLDELTIAQQQKEVRAQAAEAVVAQGLIQPHLLTEQNDLIRQAQAQSLATFSKAEQSAEVLVELVRQVEAQRHEVSTHAHRLADALAAREQLQQQLQQQTAHAAQLEREHEATQRETEGRLAAAHAALEARDQEVEALLSAHAAELAQYRETVSQMESRLFSSVQASERIQAQTQATLQQEMARTAALEQARSALQAELERVRSAQRAELEQVRSALQAELTQVRGALQVELAQQSARAEGLSQTADALRVALHQASTRTQDFEQRLHAVQAQLERQSHVAQAHLRDLQDMLHSTSWRITAPLRALRRLFLRAGPHDGPAPMRPTWRQRAGLLAERAYRGMPLSSRRKRVVKGWVFRVTGPLLANTRAYRRWQAHERTHARELPVHVPEPAPAVSVAPTESRPAALAGPAPTPVPLWRADGVREWHDHRTVRERIDTARRQQQHDKRAKPYPMISFAQRRPADVAATIKLPPVPEAPEVTVLIPAYNHLVTTLECLASIAMHADANGPSFEVLVANDGSSDDTAQVLARIDHLRLVNQPENLGFLRNCNAAAQHARGRLLVLLNNDVQVTAGWLMVLVDCLESNPDIGAVGPRIVYPSGWLQEAGTRLRRDGSSEMIGLNDLPDLPRYGYNRDVDYCSGACLLLRNADFRRLGGFDERFAPAYCEDSDLCMRLRTDGKRIVYCAQATVVHHLSTTSDAIPGDYKLRCIARNLQTFGSRWQADVDRLDDVRTIALYLPQFHPIPENDRWWGPGFTEWTNVAKARPNFVGHDQPRVPADLGYYDLRAPEVMEQQAALARRYGIGGFCYYYYWFAGQRLLEQPIEAMLETGRPAFPFCLCWANENWTRRWDGEDHDVLMAQHHSDQDDEAVIRDLIRYFRSPHYIRIGGRPLIAVYRVALFPDFKRTAAHWRQVCRDEGIGEIYIAHVESFEMVSAGARPVDYGCDAAIEFPPHGMAEPYPVSEPLLNPDFQGAVADYRDLAVRYATRELAGYKRFLGVATGWDNTARRQNNSYCFEHATPGAFQAWLESAIERTKQQFSGDERLLFINAWNEWAEGAYLEPDQRFGHAYLQAHANARDAGHLLAGDRYRLG